MQSNQEWPETRNLLKRPLAVLGAHKRANPADVLILGSGMSPFQPWQKKNMSVIGSAPAFWIRAWLIKPDCSDLSLPSASKLIKLYTSFVPGIVSKPMASSGCKQQNAMAKYTNFTGTQQVRVRQCERNEIDKQGARASIPRIPYIAPTIRLSARLSRIRDANRVRSASRQRRPFIKELRAEFYRNAPRAMLTIQGGGRSFCHAAWRLRQGVGARARAPSSYETFPLLAEVLAACNACRFRPMLLISSHWSNWPKVGAFSEVGSSTRYGETTSQSGAVDRGHGRTVASRSLKKRRRNAQEVSSARWSLPGSWLMPPAQAASSLGRRARL
jgi:uncharacterized protein DUF7003